MCRRVVLYTGTNVSEVTDAFVFRVELAFVIPTPIQSRVRTLVVHYALITSLSVIIPNFFNMYPAKTWFNACLSSVLYWP
jgi:hypothetical protein